MTLPVAAATADALAPVLGKVISTSPLGASRSPVSQSIAIWQAEASGVFTGRWSILPLSLPGRKKTGEKPEVARGS